MPFSVRRKRVQSFRGDVCTADWRYALRRMRCGCDAGNGAGHTASPRTRAPRRPHDPVHSDRGLVQDEHGLARDGSAIRYGTAPAPRYSTSPVSRRRTCPHTAQTSCNPATVAEPCNCFEPLPAEHLTRKRPRWAAWPSLAFWAWDPLRIRYHRRRSCPPPRGSIRGALRWQPARCLPRCATACQLLARLYNGRGWRRFVGA